MYLNETLRKVSIGRQPHYYYSVEIFVRPVPGPDVRTSRLYLSPQAHGEDERFSRHRAESGDAKASLLSPLRTNDQQCMLQRRDRLHWNPSSGSRYLCNTDDSTKLLRVEYLHSAYNLIVRCSGTDSKMAIAIYRLIFRFSAIRNRACRGNYT